MGDDASFTSKLKDALKKPFELLADADSGCISKRSAIAHLLLCKAKQVQVARDDEQIKMLVDLIFQEADLNGDGKISLDEAWEAVIRLESKGFPADIEVTSKEEQECLLTTIQEYTEQLSLDSKTSGENRMGQLKLLAKSIFEALDTDRSGFLDQEEVNRAILHYAEKKSFMTGVKQAESVAEFAAFFMPLGDRNGDGKISIAEFFQAAFKFVIMMHCRTRNSGNDTGLVFDRYRPSFFHSRQDCNEFDMRLELQTDLDVETATAWLGAMPVVLFTQFKIVLHDYSRAVRGLDEPTADKAARLEELIRSLHFSSAAVMESTLETLAREGMSLAALAATTDVEFDEIGVPHDVREVIRIGLIKSLAVDL